MAPGVALTIAVHRSPHCLYTWAEAGDSKLATSEGQESVCGGVSGEGGHSGGGGSASAHVPCIPTGAANPTPTWQAE
eukprot:99370-Chlamydomonas_euryale.AAC.1